jgi:hypothetical protein
LKIDEVVLGRDAPSPEEPEPPDPTPATAPPPKSAAEQPSGAAVHDPAAYEHAAAVERRRNMLRGLRGYITQVLRWEPRKLAFALVNRFIEVVDDTDAWKARPRADHTTLTRLWRDGKKCRGKIRALPLDSYEPEDDGLPFDEVARAQIHSRTESDVVAAAQRRRLAHEQERTARLEARAAERLRRHGPLW